MVRCYQPRSCPCPRHRSVCLRSSRVLGGRGHSCRWDPCSANPRRCPAHVPQRLGIRCEVRVCARVWYDVRTKWRRRHTYTCTHVHTHTYIETDAECLSAAAHARCYHITRLLVHCYEHSCKNMRSRTKSIADDTHRVRRSYLEKRACESIRQMLVSVPESERFSP